MNKLKPYLVGAWYSLPVQLFLMHFKRYQVLMLFWLILFSAIDGSFMNRFGAHMLFLYPEYLGNVSSLSLSLVGVAVAIFFMSWNITSFILHAKHLSFLATTTQPFLKYCINNSILPLAFLCFYFIKAVHYDRVQELLSYGEIFLLTGGFLLGFILALAISFTYFFGADKTIYRFMSPQVKEALLEHKDKYADEEESRKVMRVDWYLSATLKLRKPRSVKHYSESFIDQIFKQHHLVAIFSIILAFIFLIVIGFFLDNIYFQIPAAASIIVFFAILIAVAGAFSYFLRNWSLLFLIVLIVIVNILYQRNIIDPKNKAYGLNYHVEKPLPAYNRQSINATATDSLAKADSLAFINILNTWKSRQRTERPVFTVVAASGGGSRSAIFTTNVLQAIDSITANGLMPSTFMMSGASGGMIGAAWYRELYLKSQQHQIKPDHISRYMDDVSGDLLNPIFTSFIARDLLSPPQRFTYEGNRYIKDRGYAFEQKLNANTHGWMNNTLDYYRTMEDSAFVPRLLISATITRDGRKLIIGTRPARFLLKPAIANPNDLSSDVDAVDYLSFFSGQSSHQLRLLSALRMNATFPYILPNVWLPSDPVIDVMDAGFRDNTGVESSLRFLYYFRDWLKENCSKIVLLQISDKVPGGWDNPYESIRVFDLFTKPALLTQTNLFRFQEYTQLRQLEWFNTIFGEQFNRVIFTYRPINKDAAATLSFHLTQREKQDLKASLSNRDNTASFQRINQLLNDTIKAY